mmetsp:Transcript_24433/g.64431  ORF Transcript_24433/g.64431 Transcript_24433/m.64431 type:complete len:264 (+) Transcript_24433:174-965(+)
MVLMDSSRCQRAGWQTRHSATAKKSAVSGAPVGAVSTQQQYVRTVLHLSLLALSGNTEPGVRPVGLLVYREASAQRALLGKYPRGLRDWHPVYIEDIARGPPRGRVARDQPLCGGPPLQRVVVEVQAPGACSPDELPDRHRGELTLAEQVALVAPDLHFVAVHHGQQLEGMRGLVADPEVRGAMTGGRHPRMFHVLGEVVDQVGWRVCHHVAGKLVNRHRARIVRVHATEHRIHVFGRQVQVAEFLLNRVYEHLSSDFAFAQL